MDTNRLENFINENRAEFDQLEPSPKVWKNIAEKSKKKKAIQLNTILLRVAAILVLTLLLSVLAIKSNILIPDKMAKNISDPELRELMEAEAYYAHQVDGKLKEIQKCYYTNPNLKQEIESDLNELQEMYNILKSDLNENIAQKTVIEAMIENNRIRLKLVNDVLEQINC
ncbi:MAG: hypothetical protein JXR61_02920 [Prolixibacteraceae bacterium]|nr:hypothetical protein [Prolixibacteraceae bacterium]